MREYERRTIGPAFFCLPQPYPSEAFLPCENPREFPGYLYTTPATDGRQRYSGHSENRPAEKVAPGRPELG